MTVLVHIDVFGGVPDPEALGVLGAARSAGCDVTAVVVGHELGSAADVVSAHGPARVIVVDDPLLATPASAPRLAVIRSLIAARPDGGRWLASTNTLTIEIAGALAGDGIGVAWGLVGISDGAATATRLSGNETIEAEIGWTTGWGAGLFRPHAFDPVALPSAAPVEAVVVGVPAHDDRGVTVDESETVGGGGDLAGADVIVAAGRGIGDPSRLDLVRALADRLGGVAGVSLPLVELGWAPRSMQVGQTGTIVAPLLYVACGISGQIQHRVGMERSGTIVAINTDAAAPIMRFCDLAVVADVATVLPRLIELLDERPESGAT